LSHTAPNTGKRLIYRLKRPAISVPFARRRMLVKRINPYGLHVAGTVFITKFAFWYVIK